MQPPVRNRPGPAWNELLRYWGFVVLWMVFISTLSGEGFSAANTHRYVDPLLRYFFPNLTPAGFVLAHGLIRKAAHLTEFFILGLLAFWAARRGRSSRWRWQWAVQALLLGAVYALADETHQMFVPNRTGSYLDSLIDCGGVLASQAWIYWRRGWGTQRISSDS